ncbi:hypothetical protein [Brevifollis gellanilyticus]|uniref:Uncharacterized protein n=1 Tax=Brevifollis gellanilyticus TaxID=748831 RepID=A0A512MHG1_9BACT|nr:hypothetical protein [Brevifollis gellanilyticus]GEP46177.1 hypothetical protein BGE01nite_54680 [Brevifollis gellanilyticus]
MKALLLLSVLISLASPALARIGETPEQCEARYGKPVKIEEEGQAFRYRKAGFNVTCVFRNGACVHMAFSHVADAQNEVAPMSESEITTLLTANGSGKTWVKDEKASSPDSGVWTCGELKASYAGYGLNSLHINTKAFRDEKEAEKNGKPKDPLKDF